MTMRRVLVFLVTLAAMAKTLGLGAMWLAPADVAGAASLFGARHDDGGESACAADERGFRELVESVRAKAGDLERRETALEAREAGLAAVRRAVASEVARLEGVAKTLGIVGTPDGSVSIARVYESMSAEDAAPILDRLDDATLRAVLGRMRERQLGAILASMNPDRAVAVTKAFASPAVAAPPAQPR